MAKIDFLVFMVTIILPIVSSSNGKLLQSPSDEFPCCSSTPGMQGTLKVTCPVVGNDSISCVRDALQYYTDEQSQPLDVYFTNCDISAFDEDFFEPYNVVGLEFNNCGLKVVPVEVFNSVCPHIFLGLSFTSNYIEYVSPNDFKGCFRATVLDLAYNKISNLSVDAFQYMTQLQSLYLFGNGIQRIDGFRSLANLRQLLINENDIQDISINAFDGLEMVLFVNLADNSLTTLEDNVFAPLKSLSTLDLKHNQFDCVCSLKWLQEWIIQHGLAQDTTCELPMHCDMVSFEFCSTTTTPMITTQSTTKLLTSTTSATSTSSSTAATRTIPTSTAATRTIPTSTTTTSPTSITTRPTSTTTKPTTIVPTTQPITTLSTTEPTTTTSTTAATTTQSTTELVTSTTPETTTTISTTITPTTIPCTTTPTYVPTDSLQSSTASGNGDNGEPDFIIENFTLFNNLTLTWESTENKVIIMYSPVAENCSTPLISGTFLNLADGVHAVILEKKTVYTIQDYDDDSNQYLVCIVAARLNHTIHNFICGKNCLNTDAPPPPNIDPTEMPAKSA